MNDDVLVRIQDLKTWFHTDDGTAKAVDGVSLDVCRGKTLGLVGESGCGKSVTSLSILRLIPRPPGEIAGGRILFRVPAEQDDLRELCDEDGFVDLLKLSERQMRSIRGNDIAMIFQEPMTSLNPVYTVGNQIMEAVTLHQHVSLRQARERTLAMLREVGIPSPEIRINDYPHQMSGGMKQRVMIAMALACNPALLIADEPSTALDVTIQAQILRLLKRLQTEHDMAILLITHDLGVIAENADDVAVMYASKIVEEAEVAELFGRPLHPYTVGLFQSLPKLGEKTEKLAVIPGTVPNPLEFPSGCKFHPRCFMAQEICGSQEPGLREIAPGHTSACHFAEKLLEGLPETVSDRGSRNA